MALPSTRADLATWILNSVLQAVAVSLEWTTSSAPITNALDEIELDLGHSISSEGATRRLLGIARVKAWRAAVEGTADRFRVSSDGQAVDLQQVHDHAVAMLQRAEADYADILANPDASSSSRASVGIYRTRTLGNPYDRTITYTGC